MTSFLGFFPGGARVEEAGSRELSPLTSCDYPVASSLRVLRSGLRIVKAFRYLKTRLKALRVQVCYFMSAEPGSWRCFILGPSDSDTICGFP